MSYYDMYLSLYEGDNKFYFCDEDIINLFGIEPDKVSFDTYNNLISLLDKSIEVGFNEGFKFAMNIFFNNL